MEKKEEKGNELESQNSGTFLMLTCEIVKKENWIKIEERSNKSDSQSHNTITHSTNAFHV